MGICASSTGANSTSAEDVAEEKYRKELEKIEAENEKNLLSLRTFNVVKRLGYGYLVLPAASEHADSGPVTTLDGEFSMVTVLGHEQSRKLHMRTFRRRHLLRGGMMAAVQRVAPYTKSIGDMNRTGPCRFVFPLEHAFYDKNNCVLVFGAYATDMQIIQQKNIKLEEDALTSIMASLSLALDHLHSSKPPVIAGSENLQMSHVIVDSAGHVTLSILPTNATQVSSFHDAQNDKTPDVTSTSMSDENTQESEKGAEQKESPGAKYRVQKKQSEIRSDMDPSTLEKRRQLKSRDWLLLGRLMASVCNLGVDASSGQVIMDTEIIESVKSSSLDTQIKQILCGLLDADDEKRWSFKNVKDTISGPKYPWTVLEDSKELLRPPPIIPQEALASHILELEEQNMKAASKFEAETEAEVEASASNLNTPDHSVPTESALTSSESPPYDVDDDLDSIPSEDSLARLDEDELLPWEVSEVLEKWDYRSTVASLHQISNFTNSRTMANFASYDAKFYRNKNKGEKLRSDLSGIGKILEDGITSNI